MAVRTLKIKPQERHLVIDGQVPLIHEGKQVGSLMLIHSNNLTPTMITWIVEDTKNVTIIADGTLGKATECIAQGKHTTKDGVKILEVTHFTLR